MPQKIALFAASMAAALVIAGGLALAGLAPQAPDAGAVQVVDQVAATADPVPPEPAVQVDTVYLTPQVKPKDITVTKVKVAKATGGETEGREGGEGD
jgi:hypothetical protein